MAKPVASDVKDREKLGAGSARRLHGVAMIEHAASAADFRDVFDREQHTRFVARPHRKSSRQLSVVS
jgi:hypothetical protein